MKRENNHFKDFIIPVILLFFASTVLAKGITVTYNQAKLGLVLQSLSKMTGIKLITSAELAEKPVSAYLEDVSGEEAIDSILKANGLYREKIPGTDIYIVKVSGETVSPLKSETFFLQYAKAEDLGKVLSSLISSNGQIVIDPRTNSITIKETPELLEEMKKIVSSLDKTIPQVAIEAILVELTTDSLKNLGIRWNIEGSWFGPQIDTSFPYSESYTREVVSPRRGTLTTATQNPQFTLGTLSFATLTTNLKILEDKGEANILANPRITTLNDSPATIKITKNMAVAPKVTETIEAGRVVTEYEYRDVGVSLKVVPHVNAEGVIILEVEPTVSSATPSAVFKDAVDTNERTAKTKVMVKSGDTLVIGGLLRQDTTGKKTKVPILGDIFPFLFSRTDKQKGKTDLVMFLTPRIITGEEATVEAEKEKSRMEKQEVKE
ncbi:MAG TPA: secretin N-terminal domain-containing protein [bacterium]|nr:secretin N-terminal domain-containing protein [bacterium]HPP30187.1 secretin N-terminal domain-containing protein [bacterium]